MEQIPATPIDRRSIPDVIFRALRRDIAQGVYGPGPIRIRPIAERFGVSATPVREALQRLEGEGLVTLRNNQIVINALSEAELREVFAIRRELESFVVRQGADQMRGACDLFEDLELLIAEMDQNEHEPEQWQAANERFHMRIYRMAGMPRLESLIDSLWVTVEPYLRLYVTTAGSFRAAQDQHRSILRHLQNGEFEQAAAVLREHLTDTERVVAEGIRRQVS